MLAYPTKFEIYDIIQQNLYDIYRAQIPSHCRSMVAKAVAWAKEAKKLRTSPVHGEEELYLILSETIQSKEREEEEVNQQGGIEVEVGVFVNSIGANCC